MRNYFQMKGIPNDLEIVVEYSRDVDFPSPAQSIPKASDDDTTPEPSVLAGVRSCTAVSQI